MTALVPGHFTVLAARPSMGKSALALDIARNFGVTQGKTVGISSLEMTKEEIFDRLVGALSNIAPWQLAKGMRTEDEFTRRGPSMDRLDASHIFIDDDSNRTLTTIRSKARRLQMEYGLDLVIIDYLQLIRVPLYFDAKRMSFRSLNQKERSEPKRHALPML